MCVSVCVSERVEGTTEELDERERHFRGCKDCACIYKAACQR